jgi:hypothetical protein
MNCMMMTIHFTRREWNMIPLYNNLDSQNKDMDVTCYT